MSITGVVIGLMKLKPFTLTSAPPTRYSAAVETNLVENTRRKLERHKNNHGDQVKHIVYCRRRKRAPEGLLAV